MSRHRTLLHALVQATSRSLERHFRTDIGQAQTPLRNPHHEPKVTPAHRANAKPAAVLLPILLHDTGPTILLTERHADISFPGHAAFPGGRPDPSDSGPVETALREAEEEIALARGAVRVIGRLGDYVTQSGYRIAPIVGLVTPPVSLVPRPNEVEAIFEVPLSHALDSRSYQLRQNEGYPERGHYSLEYAGHVVAGPTVSILIGLYEELLKTHLPGGEADLERLAGEGSD